jgi:hypothetical protein
MKTLFAFFSAFILCGLVVTQSAFAQQPKAPGSMTEPNQMTAGLGMTWIDDQPYYLINIAPELAFGNLGLGLDLELHISSKDHKIRKQDFDEAYDYVRIIRYIRWGQRDDKFYARLGELENAEIGYGFITYMYNNSPSWDDRRVGAEFDLNFQKYGLETMYSDFVRAGVFGFRPHVKPLQFTTIGKVPVIGGMEIGATWAGDFRPDSKDVSFDSTGGVRKPLNSGGINILGADIGFPLVRIPTVSSTLYGDYAKIVDFGSGEAVGLETNFSGMGLLQIFTKLERRWMGNQFIPNYFDALYEIERYQLSQNTFFSKAQTLQNTVSPGPGYFGGLTISLLGRLQVLGTYQRLDNDPKSGILELGTTTGSMLPMLTIDAGYDKKYIQNNKDIFTLDDRSLLYATVGYKVYPFMTIEAEYLWTFEPVKDPNGNVSYVTQKQVIPKVLISFPL